MVGVKAHQGRHVEGRGETGLSVGEQIAESLVGLLDRAEAGELPHRPEAPPVHRRVDPAGERVGAGEALVALAVVAGAVEVVLGIERLDRRARESFEADVPLALVGVGVLQPLMGATLRVRFDRHGLRLPAPTPAALRPPEPVADRASQAPPPTERPATATGPPGRPGRQVAWPAAIHQRLLPAGIDAAGRPR